MLPWLAASGVAIVVGVVAILIVGDGESADPAEAVPTTTDVIAGRGTVVPRPPPEPCPTDPDSLAVWTAAVRIDEAVGTADAVVRFENRTRATCELELTDPASRVGVEASVRLPPGGWGELLIGSVGSVGSVGSECDRLAPLRAAVLEVNGDDLPVLTTALIACDPALLAFLPADHPVAACLPSQLATAVAPAGIVVRNASERPCVLGELVSVELPTGPVPSLTEMAETRPDAVIDGAVGVELTGLGPGDIAYFETLVDPTADCPSSVQPARLNFSDVRIDGQFPICTFVRLGAGRPYFGSPRGPLADASEPVAASHRDLDVWIAALDPFRD